MPAQNASPSSRAPDDVNAMTYFRLPLLQAFFENPPLGMFAAALAAVSIALLVFTLANGDRGFDFSDEGMYLNTIRAPWSYPPSTTQFGFFYYPVFRSIGGDFVLLRQINVSATFILFAILAWSTMRGGHDTDRKGWPTFELCIAIALAAPSIAFLQNWILTPSYNSLTLQGMALTGIGLARQSAARPIHSSDPHWRLAGTQGNIAGILIGIGGVLAFLGKPSSAALLGIAAGGAIVLASPQPLKALAVAGLAAVSCLLAASLMIDGSPVVFLERLKRAVEAAASWLPFSSNSWLNPGGLSLPRRELFIFVGLLAIGLTTHVALRSSLRVAGVLVAVVAALAVAVSALWLLHPLDNLWLWPTTFKTAVLFSAVPLSIFLSMPVIAVGNLTQHRHRCAWLVMHWAPAGLLVLILTYWMSAWNGTSASVGFVAVLAAFAVIIVWAARTGRESWCDSGNSFAAKTAALAMFLLLCPHIFAVGTNNLLNRHAMLAIGFIPIAALATLPTLALWRDATSIRHSQLLLASASVPITVLIVLHSMAHPYRQNAPLLLQNEIVRIGGPNAVEVRVDPVAATYLRHMQQAFAAGGGNVETPVIDLTGGHPGTVFALGGRATGLPWLIGGYPGSRILVEASLSSVPCNELARAFVLAAPSYPRALTPDVIEHVGIPLPVRSLGTHAGPTSPEPQSLLMPEMDFAKTDLACKEKRLR